MDMRDLLKEAGDVNVEDAYPKTFTVRERVNSVGLEYLLDNDRVQFVALVVRADTRGKLPEALAKHEELLAAIPQYRPVEMNDEIPVDRVGYAGGGIRDIPVRIARGIVAPKSADEPRWKSPSLIGDSGDLLSNRVSFVSDIMILTTENGHMLLRTRELPSGTTVTLD